MNIEQQRQHILSGAYYNDLTPELIKAREEAVRLSNLYNDSFCAAPAKREAYLRQLLKK